MEGIVDLHHEIMFYCVIIFAAVFYLILTILWDFSFRSSEISLMKGIFLTRNVSHNSDIELYWTLLPSCLLVVIAIPSFNILYWMDTIMGAEYALKVIGHQWFWSYEYGDFYRTIVLDSYIVQEADLQLGDYRLSTVDNPVVVPTDTCIRVLVTSTDVLHSYSIPSLGLKLDAVPGRLNQAQFAFDWSAISYGACSELCGVGHGYMPLTIAAVSDDQWLSILLTIHGYK